MDQSIWHEVFRILVTTIPKFVYPSWFSYLAEKIPADSPRARRDGPRFLSLLQVVTRCRSFADGRWNKSEVAITFGDYCVAYQIFNEAFAATYAGAHPRALEFAQAVRDLYAETKRPVLTNDVMEHLEWEKSLAHKWRAVAVRQKLIRYEEGTHEQNKKPLLPGPAQQATTFLPDPHLVFEERRDLGDEVRFIDPLSGEEQIFRRKGAKPSKKA